METHTRVAEIESRLAAVTPGPWRACGDTTGGCVCGQVWSIPADAPVACTDTDSDIDGISSTTERKIADAAFIAAAPEDMAFLLKLAKPSAEWIAVTERLPEEGRPVLVYSRYWSANPFVARLDKNRYWEGEAILSRPDSVTHWRPLPPSPRAEESGE